SPMLELFAPGDDVNPVMTSHGNQLGTDIGSSSALDPFLQYNFTPGTYKVRVGTWIQYASATRYSGTPNTFKQSGPLGGVMTGQSYDLYISLPGHASNPNAISLAGKEITLVDGTGKGQTGTIASYNPETKTYVVTPDDPTRWATDGSTKT